jgi:TRAP-type uncharacterized transport system fused permease subunit
LLLNVVPVAPFALVEALATAVMGTVALAMALQGWALREAGWIERAVLLTAALLLIAPGMASDAVGFVLFAGVLGWQKLSRGAKTSESVPAVAPRETGGPP